jgi:hypothetical protein
LTLQLLLRTERNEYGLLTTTPFENATTKDGTFTATFNSSRS